jgi:hypothetical protein
MARAHVRDTVGAHRADPARSITLVTQLVMSHACPKSHSKIDYDSAFKRRMDVDLQLGRSLKHHGVLAASPYSARR